MGMPGPYKKKAVLLCTYCSAVKRRDRQLLPAIRRYLSPRIRAVYRESKQKGAGFAILSGQFGLIGPWEKIRYYNHLLKSSEIHSLLPRMVGYLERKKYRAVRFYHEPLRSSPKIRAYLKAIAHACRATGVRLTLVEIALRRNI